jgi:hypothetical protein
MPKRATLVKTFTSIGAALAFPVGAPLLAPRRWKLRLTLNKVPPETTVRDADTQPVEPSHAK